MGKHSMVSPIEATLIHVDNNATVVYGEEVKLLSIPGCALELPEEIEQLLGVRRLMGWLIYTNNPAYRNHDLVVTKIPARNLYFQGKLQRSSHRKKNEIVSELRKMLEKIGLSDPIRAISQALSSLPFQPFESRNDVVSAWLIEPRVIEELSITHQRMRGVEIRSDETMKSSLRGSFAAEKAEWSLGICKDIDRCIGLLEIDEEKERLFEKTENGARFECYWSGKSPGRAPVYRLMTAIAADLHEEVYRAAIMAALAGMDESLYPNGSKNGIRPVINQVKVLYQQFMYALVKRLGFSNPVLNPEIPSSAVASFGPFKTLHEELEEMGEKIRPLGQGIFMLGLEKTVANLGLPDETLARLILSAPKEWALSAKLVSWLRRYQSQFSKTVQEIIEERLCVQ